MERNLYPVFDVNLLFSAECTIGMVRGLTPLKRYGAMALLHYGTISYITTQNDIWLRYSLVILVVLFSYEQSNLLQAHAQID